MLPVIRVSHTCSSPNADLTRRYFIFADIFMPDRYSQILMSVQEYIISVEHIHCLEGIYRILLGSS